MANENLLEIGRVYLRYLYVKSKIKTEFKEYLMLNYVGDKKDSNYKTVMANGKEDKIKNHVSIYLTDQGELNNYGVDFIKGDIAKRLKGRVASTPNLHQKLLQIWLVLNYTQEELTTNKFKKFITLYAVSLGLPELLIYHKKESEVDVDNERKYYVQGLDATKGVELIGKKSKNVYILTDKGRGVAEVFIDVMRKDLIDCYYNFS